MSLFFHPFLKNRRHCVDCLFILSQCFSPPDRMVAELMKFLIQVKYVLFFSSFTAVRYRIAAACFYITAGTSGGRDGRHVLLRSWTIFFFLCNPVGGAVVFLPASRSPAITRWWWWWWYTAIPPSCALKISTWSRTYFSPLRGYLF